MHIILLLLEYRKILKVKQDRLQDIQTKADVQLFLDAIYNRVLDEIQLAASEQFADDHCRLSDFSRDTRVLSHKSVQELGTRTKIKLGGNDVVVVYCCLLLAKGNFE